MTTSGDVPVEVFAPYSVDGTNSLCDVAFRVKSEDRVSAGKPSDIAVARYVSVGSQ